MSEARYEATELVAWAAQLLGAAGLESGRAEAVAGILVEGDLLGHTTHGLALLGPYLRELESGSMAATGEPQVLQDLPALAAVSA